ncbi:MAG: enoyl-CoA hydratase [SAR202 cluster bacterium]|nr:enoyl-CoA hydratase [SAR202 cluster bacterium]
MTDPTAPTPAPVLVRRDGDVATVVLNRPDQRNAISLAMWRRLAEVFHELDADLALRVVLVTGAGDEAFSAGADIKEFEETRGTPEKARAYGSQIEAACDALAKLGKPTIAVIRGYCLGGGFEVALYADLRIAAGNAKFAIPGARMGLAVAHHYAARVVELAGPSDAAYLLYTGRTIDAAEAFRMRLVNSVHPAADLDAYVAELVKDIAALSPVSHRTHKGVLLDLARHGTVGAVPSERKVLSDKATDSDDFREGVRAFMEKRRPRFMGH